MSFPCITKLNERYPRLQPTRHLLQLRQRIIQRTLHTCKRNHHAKTVKQHQKSRHHNHNHSHSHSRNHNHNHNQRCKSSYQDSSYQNNPLNRNLFNRQRKLSSLSRKRKNHPQKRIPKESRKPGYSRHRPRKNLRQARNSVSPDTDT